MRKLSSELINAADKLSELEKIVEKVAKTHLLFTNPKIPSPNHRSKFTDFPLIRSWFSVQVQREIVREFCGRRRWPRKRARGQKSYGLARESQGVCFRLNRPREGPFPPPPPPLCNCHENRAQAQRVRLASVVVTTWAEVPPRKRERRGDRTDCRGKLCFGEAHLAAGETCKVISVSGGTKLGKTMGLPWLVKTHSDGMRFRGEGRV